MSKKHVSVLTLVIVCGFFLSCFLPTYLSGRESSTEERFKALEHELTRLQDINAIKNLQGRYETIHSTDEGLSWMLFADRSDTTKEITADRIVGFDNIKADYLRMSQMMGGDSPEGETPASASPFAGMPGGGAPAGMSGAMVGQKFTIHPIATPVIEVAADGKTAKATFTSFGFEGGEWCYGKYANDYIKIDGEWYIWHMKWLRCFKTDFYTSWQDQTLDEIYEFTHGETDEWGFPKVREDINYDYLRAPGKRLKSITVPRPYETWTEADENGGWWKRETVIP